MSLLEYYGLFKGYFYVVTMVFWLASRVLLCSSRGFWVVSWVLLYVLHPQVSVIFETYVRYGSDFFFLRFFLSATHNKQHDLIHLFKIMTMLQFEH